MSSPEDHPLFFTSRELTAPLVFACLVERQWKKGSKFGFPFAGVPKKSDKIGWIEHSLSKKGRYLPCPAEMIEPRIRILTAGDL